MSLPPASSQIDYTTQMKERQAYFVSRLLLLCILATSITVVIKLFDPGPLHIVWIPISSLIFCILLTIWNRLGLVTLAGSGVLFATIGPLVAAILVHIPFQETDLPLFYLLITSEIVAGLLLPPVMILAVAVFNCLLVIFMLYFLPLAPSFRLALSRSPDGIFFPLFALSMEVAVGIYIVVVSLSKEVYRASYAEKLARLQAQVEAEKQQLQEGINHIAYVHAQIANGHFEARVSMHERNILWEVAVPLNNLLGRVQSWKQEASRYQCLEQAVNDLTNYFEQGSSGSLPSLSQTSVDRIIKALQQQKNHPSAQADPLSSLSPCDGPSC